MQNVFRFHFCVPFSSIKSYNNTSEVFSRHEQETGKQTLGALHKTREAKKFHSLHRFDPIRHHPNSPVTVSRPYRRPSGAGGDINKNNNNNNNNNLKK